MRKMTWYAKAYGTTDPQLIEGDMFEIIVKVREFGPANEVQPAASQARVRRQGTTPHKKPY
jgi:hypothetical protein